MVLQILVQGLKVHRFVRCDSLRDGHTDKFEARVDECEKRVVAILTRISGMYHQITQKFTNKLSLSNRNSSVKSYHKNSDRS